MKSGRSFTVINAASLALIIPFFLSCDKGSLPPVAVLSALPSIGDTSIVFIFDAGASADDRSYSLALFYRWDFDGDGLWDTDYSKYSAIAHRFKQPGNYAVAVEVKDLDNLSAIARDSVIVFGENPDIDTLYDSRDGNKYRIVKISGQWWMAENLRYGTVIPTEREPTDNDTVERYEFTNNPLLDTVGGIYSWFETKNYHAKDNQGICPDGWHLPTRQEWEGILTPYPYEYALKYYSKDGLSKLNLDLNNGGIRKDGFFEQHQIYGGYNIDAGFWSSSYKLEEQQYLPYFCSFTSKAKILRYAFWSRFDAGLSRYYSVRCVKGN